MAVLGRLLGVLRRSWVPLGRLLGVPWTVLGVSWVHLGPLGRLLGASSTIWDRFWRVSGKVWEGLGWGQGLKISVFSY